MICEAKIHDEFGNKYKCLKEATSHIVIETFVPHLKRGVVTVRHLCAAHAKSLNARHNYKIKHCGKKTTIIDTKIPPPYPTIPNT